jgi:hypothetical protein
MFTIPIVNAIKETLKTHPTTSLSIKITSDFSPCERLSTAVMACLELEHHPRTNFPGQILSIGTSNGSTYRAGHAPLRGKAKSFAQDFPALTTFNKFKFAWHYSKPNEA